MEYFTLDICGLKRELPIVYVGKNTRIANFTILGDVELTDRLADKITEKLRKVKFDYLVGPEVKVVPLIHGVTKRLGQKKFILCRKSVKPYMVNPVILKPLPHFPKHIKQLVLNGPDANLLKGKKVVLLDDVVSTGVTMRMLHKLMEKVGATVVQKIAVIRQGEQFDKMENLFCLTELPVLKNTP
jgi:adenine phosphoribosyltransferase